MSSTIKVLLFSAERNDINQINRLLEKNNQYIVLGSAARAIDAIKMIKQHQPQLVILSNELYGGTGLDVIECIDSKNLVLALYSEQNVSEQAQYMKVDFFTTESINSDAIEEITKLVENHQNKGSHLPFKASKLSFQKELLTVPVANGIRSIRLSDILYLEADGSYTTIHTVNQKPIIVSKRLKLFENSLFDIHFIRINRNYLVNLFHMTEINKREYVITLTNGNQLEFSQRKKEDLIEFVKNRTSYV